MIERIVEERADAKNVNNWHWTEKNATLWSKDKLKELIVNLTFENDECKLLIRNFNLIDKLTSF
jgi:activator of HSP90 ATPase